MKASISRKPGRQLWIQIIVEIPNFANQRGPLDEKGLEFYVADSKLKATTDNWEGIIVRN